MDSGTAALAALDRALAVRPRRDGDAFSEATEHLCRLRDALISDGGDRDRLAMVNAIISAALAGHFPIGPTPWPEVQHAADQLRTLVTLSLRERAG